MEKPELLSNDQVMELLKIAFRQKPAKEALQAMLKDAGVTEPTEEEWKDPKTWGATIHRAGVVALSEE